MPACIIIMLVNFKDDRTREMCPRRNRFTATIRPPYRARRTSPAQADPSRINTSAQPAMHQKRHDAGREGPVQNRESLSNQYPATTGKREAGKSSAPKEPLPMRSNRSISANGTSRAFSCANSDKNMSKSCHPLHAVTHLAIKPEDEVYYGLLLIRGAIKS